MNKEKISPWKGTLAVAGIGLALAACEDKEVAPLTLAETPTTPSSPTLEMPIGHLHLRPDFGSIFTILNFSPLDFNY